MQGKAARRKLNVSGVGGSAVECRPINRESPGSNLLCCCFEDWSFSFSLRRPSSLRARRSDFDEVKVAPHSV